MNLFAGLEKFGIKTDGNMNLFGDEKSGNEQDGNVNKKEEVPTEEEFLLDKTIRCTVCDKVFKTRMVKSGRAKRMEPDQDLRPRHQYIDTLKYDVASCPHCGYTSLNRYFEHLTAGQIKLVKENICNNYKPKEPLEIAAYDYDTAIDMHKLSLFNAIAKKGKNSEKAYNCLIISWLLRTKGEMITGTTDVDQKKKEVCKQEEEAFYEQAYEGLIKSVSTEMFPICGMDQSTMDYLLATMSFHFKKYDIASKSLASVLTSASASRKMKDKALLLKDDIIAEIKNNR